MEAFFPGIDLSCVPMALTSVLEGAIPMGKIHHGNRVLPLYQLCLCSNLTQYLSLSFKMYLLRTEWTGINGKEYGYNQKKPKSPLL